MLHASRATVVGLALLATAPALFAQSASTYTVKRGDTLWDIARRNGTSLAALAKANPQFKNFDLIFPGDRVTLPSGAKRGRPSRPDPILGPILTHLLDSRLATAKLGDGAHIELSIFDPRGGKVGWKVTLSMKAPPATPPPVVAAASEPAPAASETPQVATTAPVESASTSALSSTSSTAASSTAASSTGDQNVPSGNPVQAIVGAANSFVSAFKDLATGFKKSVIQAFATAIKAFAAALNAFAALLGGGETDDEMAKPAPDVTKEDADNAGIDAIDAIESKTLRNVNDKKNPTNWDIWCRALVRAAFRKATGREIPELAAGTSAWESYKAFEKAGLIQTGPNPPRGAIVFWSPQARAAVDPKSKGAIYGHIAISNGNGTVITNSSTGPDGIDPAYPAENFGKITGWTLVKK